MCRSCSIRLDGLRAIYCEEHRVYNNEPLLKAMRYMS
jgi:hypothetical protein